MIILLCGLSGAGKTTLAQHVKLQVEKDGKSVEIIDGDEYRNLFFKDLSYSQADRAENIRRLGAIAHKFSKHGIITIVSAINPYKELRSELIHKYPNVKIVSVDCPIATLIERDTKGLYARALLPTGHPDKLHNLTGINDRFDSPEKPDLYLNTGFLSIAESTDMLLDFLIKEAECLTVRAYEQ